MKLLSHTIFRISRKTGKFVRTRMFARNFRTSQGPTGPQVHFNPAYNGAKEPLLENVALNPGRNLGEVIIVLQESIYPLSFSVVDIRSLSL
jgi:hypothetical protein